MKTINQLPDVLQWLFTDEANWIGQEIGFIQRQRVWSGAQFAQTLVFGWMEAPEASLSQLQQVAWDCGCKVSVKSVTTRLGAAEAIPFMRTLLERALAVSISGQASGSGTQLPFAQVKLLDSTQVSLPLALAGVWPGGGNQHRRRAGLKVQVEYDWLQGQLDFNLHPAVTNDRKLPQGTLAAGSLVVHDSGLLSVARCRHYEQQQVYWLARVSAQMGVVDAARRYWSLAAYLHQHAHSAVFDAWVQLTHQRHPVRLIALRLPAEVAHTRRDRLCADSQRRYGRAPRAETLSLCDWCVLVTNASAELLTSDQALLLYRSRWQIELLFKLWKQHGHLDQWRTTNLNRIQTEVYAKLLMLLVQHWLLVESCWHFTDRSLVKAVRRLRRFLPRLVTTLASPADLRALLDELAEGMVLCRIAKRRKRPAFFQALALFFDDT
jgi:hypothetical protein